MKIINNPPRSDWKALCERPSIELDYLESSVRNILNRVKNSGDNALIEFARQYDKASIESVPVSPQEIRDAANKLSAGLKQSIQIAAANIRKFHESQQRSSEVIETMPGVQCWRKAVAIERVGIYIPGGTAPLFSTVLMLGIPASIAGCKEIILCSPPTSNGTIHPAILYAADQAGITRMFKCGGAQAVAAMAYGTASIPPVNKIFGPGNQYVTKAKQLVSQEGVAIDLPAGPSEVLVIADEAADPGFVAADLLAQAEHGKDSQVVLVTSSTSLTQKVQAAIQQQLATLPRKAIAEECLSNSLSIVFANNNDVIDFTNDYAPEHLIINTQNADVLADAITNAGSIFIGAWSPESAGDYASGTNHTLPTNGFAKSHGGVALESFVKYITYQKLSREGLAKLGPHVETMAEAEELVGHKNSITIRLKSK